MSTTPKETLSGWGKYPRVPTEVRYSRPDGASYIMRGLGRSYGDQSVSDSGFTVLNSHNNRILSLDLKANEIEVEAGISLAEILDVLVPKQRFLPVCPGTKFVTVAGAIANDIHGKGHHIDGSFIDHVVSFDLKTVDGETLTCSRQENTDLFYANAGGCGLLGEITKAQLKIRETVSPYFDSKAFKARSLGEMMELLDTEGIQYHYSVAWIDTLSSRCRGVLVCGNPEMTPRNDTTKVAGEPKLSVPDIMPNFTLNNLSIAILNNVIHWSQSSKNGLVHYDPFFFPLDGIGAWNNGYGRNGLIQFQFVIPLAGGHENLEKIIKWIKVSGATPFLNVLKRFGPSDQRYLSFPMEGYTLALDFPANRKSILLCKQLSGEISRMGGKIYLAKDALLDAGIFREMYPEFEEWLKIKQSVDSKSMIRSALSTRLKIH